MDNRPDAEVVRDLTAASLDVNNIGQTPVMIVPAGYQIQDMSRHLPAPLRKKGTVVMNDADSFVSYFNRHETTASTIYATVTPPLFIGVLNDHAPYSDSANGWCDHRVTYACPLSKEWIEWKQFAGQPRDQIAFAEFIEAHVPDIVSSEPDEPSGGDMLQVATTFKAQKKVNFASAQRLDNGQVDFMFQEEIAGSAGPKGQIKVPERFFIGVPVFEGGSPYKVEAKLRYRLKDGNLTMWFDLVRDHKVVEAAFMDVWKEIEEKTGTTIWRGSPA